jgi:hypothetical protein
MAFTQKPGRSPFLKTGNGIPSVLMQIQKTGPGKKKPNTPTIDASQRIGDKPATTGVYNYNRPKKVADNQAMQNNSSMTYDTSKKMAKLENAAVENQVRWNTEGQAKMDSTNTANVAKFKGINPAAAAKLGNIAGNKTRKELGGKDMPLVDRYNASGFMVSDNEPAKSDDKYKKNKPFETPLKQKISKKTAYDIKEASNQKLKASARKNYAENAQAAMKNKKKK